jgi:tyrosinase
MHGRMHGRVSASGVQRFLPWHRAYLLELEKELKNINPSIEIPYWQWCKNRNFPHWLNDLIPHGMRNRNGQLYNVIRNIGVDETSLPTINSIENILKISDYTSFTLALEGWQPYGAHNQVHVFVGGTMGEMQSPADPIFWLHHAEIDRIWAIWQTNHANGHPSLIGQKAVMDPWTYRYKDLTLLTELGYIYEENQL